MSSRTVTSEKGEKRKGFHKVKEKISLADQNTIRKKRHSIFGNKTVTRKTEAKEKKLLSKERPRVVRG